MRVLKWFFHPVYLLVIIVAVALYINREVLISELSQSDEAVALLKKMDGVIASLQNSVAPSDKSDAMRTDRLQGQTKPVQIAPQPPVPQNAANAEAASVEESEPAADDEPDAPAFVAPSVAEPHMVGNMVAGAVPSVPAMTEEFPASPVANPPEGEAVAAGEETASTIRGVTSEQILRTWQQARIAAWQGDLASAIEHYQTVVTLQPDHFDAYGEMGNVMLRSGDREGAAEAYYQAAQRINKTPYRMVSWNLLNVIARLAPQKAELLYQELIRP